MEEQLSLDFGSPDIIAFTGKAHSGKDTAAHVLKELGYKHFFFAEPLYAMARVMLEYGNVDADYYLSNDHKEDPIPDYNPPLMFPFSQSRVISARIILQTLGTEWGRNIINEDIWVNILLARIAGHQKVVISDLRFPNEAAAILTMGGRVIKIERPETSPVPAHASENGVPDSVITDTIRNDGTLEEFKTQIAALTAANSLPGGKIPC